MLIAIVDLFCSVCNKRTNMQTLSKCMLLIIPQHQPKHMQEKTLKGTKKYVCFTLSIYDGIERLSESVCRRYRPWDGRPQKLLLLHYYWLWMVWQKEVNHNTIARRAAPLYFHQVVINYGNNNDNWINTTAINQSKASIYHTCCCFLAHNFCNGHVLTVKQAVIRFCLA